MKRLLALVKNEILYLYYSKTLVYVSLILLVITMFNVYASLEAVRNGFERYELTKQEYIKDGLNVDEELKKELNVVEKKREDGVIDKTIDNPLRYDYEEVGRLINTIEPKRFIVNILEMVTFLIGPFIFSFFGLAVSTYEFKNRTIKIKAIQKPWSLDVVAKQVACLLSVASIIICLILLLRLINEGVYYYVHNYFPNFAQFNIIEDQKPITNFPIKMIVSIIVCYFFSSLGFTLGLMFRKATIPLVLLALYNFLVPVMGKYDIKNIVSVIAHKYFEFSGNFQMFVPVDVKFSVALSYVTLLLMVLIMLNLVFSVKQSKYIS